MTELLDALRMPLKWALLPPGGILLLLTFGLIWRRRAIGTALILLGTSALYLLSAPVVTTALASQLEHYPALPGHQVIARGGQAILLLSAGSHRISPETDWKSQPNAASLQRLSHALKLHRETGLPIVISGGVLNEGDEPISGILGQWLVERTGIEPLALETRSQTTWENLAFSKPLLDKLGLEKVALVTHAYHMPRAMQAAQRHGVKAIPVPTGFLAMPTDAPNRTDESWHLWIPDASALAQNYLLLHELAGSAWYRYRN